MDIFLAIIRIVYVLIFFYAMFIQFKFEWGEEGKDERGKNIASKSYSIVFPLIPLGWLLIELYSSYIGALNYETYKLAIWFLLTGLMILHAINVTVLKRRY